MLKHATRKAGLPQPGDAVLIEQSCVRDERQIFDLCLRDEHAVKGISMIAWQSSGSLRMEQSKLSLP
jgi:hypothetical protein